MEQLKAVMSLVGHFLGPQIVGVIENAALEAATHGEWGPGDKTKFVEDEARKAAAATPTPVDDMLVGFAISYYNSHYAKQATAKN